MLKSILEGVNKLIPPFKSSAARQEMFNQSHHGRMLGASQPKHQVIDCGYVTAVNQGFRGSSDNWNQVKENYIEQLKQTEPVTTVIDCNNILWDGQGMQDADGKWHR